MAKDKFRYSNYYKEQLKKDFPEECAKEIVKIIKKPEKTEKVEEEVKEVIEKEEVKEETEKEAEEKEEEKKEEKFSEVTETFKIKKRWVILGSLIIIIIIFALIYLLTKPPTGPAVKLSPLDAVASNVSASATIYYKNSPLFSISGWETKLNYKNKEDRLFGKEEYKKIVFDEKGKAYTAISLDNEIRLEPLSTNPEEITKIGWFTKPEQINVSEEKERVEKQIKVSLFSKESEIKNAEFSYNFFKNKPYFKVQFSASAENLSELVDFAYGFILKEHDIYLSNGTILKNDNGIIDLNKTVEIVLQQNKKTTKNISQNLAKAVSEKIDITRKAITRKGSFYSVNDSDYEIFYNSNKSLAIIAYSPETLYFENSFLWNVFRCYVGHLSNGEYPELYFIITENAQLNYDKELEDWQISSKEYEGHVTDYIYKIVSEIEATEVKNEN